MQIKDGREIVSVIIRRVKLMYAKLEGNVDDRYGVTGLRGMLYGINCLSVPLVVVPKDIAEI